MNKIVFNENEIEVISCFERDNRIYINLSGEEIDERLNELNGYDDILEYYEENMNGLELIKYSNTFDNVEIVKCLGYYYLDCFNVIEPTEEELAEMERQRKLAEIQNKIDSIDKQFKKLDYIGTKIATGRATKEEYVDEIVLMNELASEKDLLEKELNQSLGVG